MEPKTKKLGRRERGRERDRDRERERERERERCKGHWFGKEDARFSYLWVSYKK
jgi:hypothetical protein